MRIFSMILQYDFLENKRNLARLINLYKLIVKCFRYFSQIFENKHSVSMKLWRRVLYLSSFSDSNSFMTAAQDIIVLVNGCKKKAWHSVFYLGFHLFGYTFIVVYVFSGITQHVNYNTGSIKTRIDITFNHHSPDMLKTSNVTRQALGVKVRPAFHWRGFGPHGWVKEWYAETAHHSLTRPCGPKPRQWKASLILRTNLNSARTCVDILFSQKRQ